MFVSICIIMKDLAFVEGKRGSSAKKKDMNQRPETRHCRGSNSTSYPRE